MPETNFENLPERNKVFSIDKLRNPVISLDRNKSGQYGEFLYEASSFLQRITQDGFWTTELAQSYAEGYRSCKNALEVMRRNTLLKNIVEDRPMDMTWSYDEKENTEIYSALNQVLSLDRLNALMKELSIRGEKYEDIIASTTTNLQHLFENGMGVSVSLESPFEGFWRIGFSRNLNGEDYSFYVNIDTNKRDVAILSYIPPTEILYAFRDLKTVPLIKDLIEKHPRLNIQLPPGIEEKINARRQKEKAYREKVAQLSATQEINFTNEVFESGIYVRQGSSKVIPAKEGPIGTTGVGPCVAVCAKGKTDEGKLMLGLAHMEAGQNELDVLNQLIRNLKTYGVPEEKIEIYLVGGWRTTEELQKRLLALSGRFPILGIRINMKDKNVEYPEKKNYIDVVITQNGRILFGENGEVFKIKDK
jgi:hypothetical protein